MLESVQGRGDAVERLYCAARLPALQALWDAYTPGTPFAAWLPGFYDQVGSRTAPLLTPRLRACLLFQAGTSDGARHEVRGMSDQLCGLFPRITARANRPSSVSAGGAVVAQ